MIFFRCTKTFFTTENDGNGDVIVCIPKGMLFAIGFGAGRAHTWELPGSEYQQQKYFEEVHL